MDIASLMTNTVLFTEGEQYGRIVVNLPKEQQIKCGCGGQYISICQIVLEVKSEYRSITGFTTQAKEEASDKEPESFDLKNCEWKDSVIQPIFQVLDRTKEYWLRCRNLTQAYRRACEMDLPKPGATTVTANANNRLTIPRMACPT